MKNYMVLAAEWSNTCKKSDKKELVEEILVSQIEYGLEITTGDLAREVTTMQRMQGKAKGTKKLGFSEQRWKLETPNWSKSEQYEENKIKNLASGPRDTYA